MDSVFASEFLAVAGWHLLAVMSPGPDFAIVLHQSIHAGRRVALFTSLGIASGILFHTAYCVAGFGYLLESNPSLLEALKHAAAVFLAYLGVRALHGGLRNAPFAKGRRASVAQNAGNPAGAGDPGAPTPGGAAANPSSGPGEGGAFAAGGSSARAAYFRGLGVNLLNPKVALFVISAFSIIVGRDSPLSHRLFFGGWMAAVTAGWFACVSCFLTRPRIRAAFLRIAFLVDLLLGLLLLFFAASLALGRLR